jgi:hypothetical protein
MTPQGHAMHKVTRIFGDGKTLPFTPCKKGYVPVHGKTGEQMLACPHHNSARRKRLLGQNDDLTFRSGEVDLRIFWNCDKQNDPSNKSVSLTNVPS